MTTSNKKKRGGKKRSKRERNEKRGDDGDDDSTTATTPFTSQYATDYHAPVMARECISAMLQQQKKTTKNDDDTKMNCESRNGLILVDATLGGGGHSSALLEQMQPGDILIGCDVDPDALETAKKRLKQYLMPEVQADGDIFINSNTITTPDHPIFIPVQSNFRHLHRVVPKLPHPYFPDVPLVDDSTARTVDAILMDLGVSSFQIDSAARGFAVKQDGPLDMRMHGASSSNNNNNNDHTTLTAADVCNEFSESDLVRSLRRYGDEPRAKAVARSIVERRPLRTTGELAAAVAAVTPEFARKGKRLGRNSTLARVFQALRIVVNEEDAALREALEDMAGALVTKEGGRLVVLSYHSMEDRMVKRVLRDGQVNKLARGRADERDLYGNRVGAGKPWRPSVGKGRKASEEEVRVNSRARSATLRVGERLLQQKTEAET